ncbi:MAG: sulfatase-like hydrolase/transferase [Opitutales bacterium]
MIKMEPIMNIAQKTGVQHCHVEQDQSPAPLDSIRKSSELSESTVRKLLALLIGSLTILWANAEIKNILLIVSDDLKADVLGCYGNRIARTPHLDRLAEEGTLFQNAYCQGTACAPSRASFMRGRYVGKKEITWGEHFQKNGFSSTRVG